MVGPRHVPCPQRCQRGENFCQTSDRPGRTAAVYLRRGVHRGHVSCDEGTLQAACLHPARAPRHPPCLHDSTAVRTIPYLLRLLVWPTHNQCGSGAGRATGHGRGPMAPALQQALARLDLPQAMLQRQAVAGVFQALAQDPGALRSAAGLNALRTSLAHASPVRGSTASRGTASRCQG